MRKKLNEKVSLFKICWLYENPSSIKKITKTDIEIILLWNTKNMLVAKRNTLENRKNLVTNCNSVVVFSKHLSGSKQLDWKSANDEANDPFGTIKLVIFRTNDSRL